MQANDGYMVGLNNTQFRDFLDHGSMNVCTAGDVFRVRHCYFRVENISDYGISAKSISRREYIEGKRTMHGTIKSKR